MLRSLFSKAVLTSQPEYTKIDVGPTRNFLLPSRMFAPHVDTQMAFLIKECHVKQLNS